MYIAEFTKYGIVHYTILMLNIQCTYFLTTTLHAVFSILLNNVTRMQSVDTVRRTLYVRIV